MVKTGLINKLEFNDGLPVTAPSSRTLPNEVIEGDGHSVWIREDGSWLRLT